MFQQNPSLRYYLSFRPGAPLSVEYTEKLQAHADHLTDEGIKDHAVVFPGITQETFQKMLSNLPPYFHITIL